MRMSELSKDACIKLQERYGIGTLCAKVIVSKGLKEEQIHELFQENQLCDPMDATGMREVIERIHQAKEKKEKVIICGDYDADGICATAILYDALHRFGIPCGFYIPNRFKEGYGLHVHTVDMAKEKGYTLLITVDNGVKSIDALHHCKDLRMDTIVTDHHAMDEDVPCDILLHSLTMGERFSNLCGAGIALMISHALLGEVKEHVILACVASIGDVMPLWKETRQIVKKGLIYLNQGICLPVQCLSKDAYSSWDVQKIAFQVVPKLNTTGRLADLANANNTVRYLLMKDQMNIIAFAKQIEELNQRRRLLSAKMCDLARALKDDSSHFQVLYDSEHHEGLSGIVAAKLCEEFQMPVLVFAQDGELLKGSIRSNHFVDLRNFFKDCPITLVSYGGHKAAAGISIRQEDLPAFKSYLKEKTKSMSYEQVDTESDVILCTIQELSVRNVEELESLAPFGEGFIKPQFYVKDYPIHTIKQLSNGKHVKWESLENVDALYFNAKDVYAKYQNETKLSFLGSLSINHFRNEKKVNIFIQEVIS